MPDTFNNASAPTCGKKSKRLFESLGFFDLLVRHSDKIVGAYVVKFAKLYQVVDLQLRAPVLDMTVALLRFIEYSSDLLLREVVVLAQISHSRSVIHKNSLQIICKKFTTLIN